MTALISYVGKPKPGPRRAKRTERPKFQHSGPPKPLSEVLGPYSTERALFLFKSGHDTHSIAWLLACTESAAANALARARDAERGQ